MAEMDPGGPSDVELEQACEVIISRRVSALGCRN